MSWRSIFCCPRRKGFQTDNGADRRDMQENLVKTAQGILQGVNCKVIESYIAFKGIPYAKPPVGKLRFKAPEPPEPWSGIRDASSHGPICPQYNERINRLEPGSEDCLYLNVYTKTITPSQLLPVMVWIHGGGFYTGSGNSDFYGPDFLLAHDVILVTINYRLEVLGFLCLDTEDVPGNAGLKDQVMALSWVKNNIKAFGGDPNNVTIFGCSAGAASVSHHLISKSSEGLFDKAICQSGVCLHEWSYSTYGRQRAFQLGKSLGKETDDPKELLEFLQEIPTSSLVKVQLPPLDIKHKDITDSIMFGPVLENSELRVEKFLSEPPPDIVKKGGLAKVPVMLGYTSGEGIEIARNLQHLIDFLAMKGSVVPREIKILTSEEQIKHADQKIREHYFGKREISLDLIQEYANLESDKMFTFNIIRFARHSPIPVYMYKFVAETERNITKKQYKMESLQGVCHSDDLPYLFHITNLDIPLTDESTGIINNISRLWTNFAKTGKPTSAGPEEWKPFTSSERYFYTIGKEFKCERDLEEKNMLFWESIYEKID